MEAGVVEPATPGLTALFGALDRTRGHSILDLGAGSSRRLELYAPFARRIRFAALLPDPDGAAVPHHTIDSLPEDDEHPYDVVLLWDVFDHLGGDDRRALVDRIVGVSVPGARLYASVDGADPRLLPAHVERLLAPFDVVHAYSLRIGRREYVGRRP